jgi:hypothetical protein
VELSEHGVSETETCRSDIKLYLYISKGIFVGVMNEKFNFHHTADVLFASRTFQHNTEL